MKTGITISVIGHAAVLLWSVVSFGVRPLSAPPIEFASRGHHLVDRVLADDRGREDRAQGRDAEAAGREGRGAEAARREPHAKVVDKPEIVTASTKAAGRGAKPAEAKRRQGSRAEDRSDRRSAEEGREHKKRRADEGRGEGRRSRRSRRSRSSIRSRSTALLDKREGQRRRLYGQRRSADADARHRHRQRARAVAERDGCAMRARLATAGTCRPACSNPEEVGGERAREARP